MTYLEFVEAYSRCASKASWPPYQPMQNISDKIETNSSNSRKNTEDQG